MTILAFYIRSRGFFMQNHPEAAGVRPGAAGVVATRIDQKGVDYI